MPQSILRLDTSARHAGSVSRELVDKIITRLGADSKIVTRDLADGVPFVDEEWVNANFTPPAQRSAAQIAKLSISDDLVAELKAADTLVIGLPIYNFCVPAAMKAWIDQVARAGVTFQYTENGPKGLLRDKRVIIVVASGGVPVGSEADFATGYMRHVLGFLGLTDVEFVNADRLMMDAEASLKSAHNQIETLAVLT